MYLQRYHDMQISHSGVWRVLKRLDMKPVYQLPLVCALDHVLRGVIPRVISQDSVELAIYRVLGDSGVVVPGDRMSALAREVVTAASPPLRKEADRVAADRVRSLSAQITELETEIGRLQIAGNAKYEAGVATGTRLTSTAIEEALKESRDEDEYNGDYNRVHRASAAVKRCFALADAATAREQQLLKQTVAPAALFKRTGATKPRVARNTTKE